MNEGAVHIKYYRINEQKVDVFTKPLGGAVFTKIIASIRVKSKFGLGEALLKY